MKKRFLCMFCALCLALSLLSPITVQAAATASSPVQEVRIGSATLNAAKPYYHNGADGAQGTADDTADSANASFDADTGTLTLNGLNIVTNEVGIWWTYSYQGTHDLKIVLADGTTNTVDSSANYAIEGNSGYSGDGPSLIIEGSGTLNVTGSRHGIWVWHDVTIQGNVTVNATGETGYGICNNDSAGTITIKDTVNVAATGGTYGIGYDNSDTKANIPVIQGGTVAVSGGTAAVRVKAGSIKHALDLTGYAGGCIVTVGDNAASSTEWDIRNSLADYKYIKIQSGLHTHSWAADWSKNETIHWHNCLKPGCNVTADNTKDSYGEHVYTDDADADCNICGYYRTSAPPSNPDITEIPEVPPQKDNVTVNDETEDGEEDAGSSDNSAKQVKDNNSGKWVKDDNGWWFSFTDKSYPVSRWLKVTEKWYYFNAAGYMATGWQKVDGRWYYLDPVNGDMAEGWKLLNGKWYYLNPVSGDMAEGWKFVNGKWYYLVPSSGECLMNTTTPDGYKVDENGAWIQ